ncbi:MULTISPECIES: hypothetical protein [Bradyrhizobium]|uniref:hypothetical protein n=1 Tax=Bradyrhizobium elkanii TaxID=29448 RepID=UPI0027148050|nr:hypothetical protein [Bradyrhizobium elkanii]WLA47288.1 hypothetical protein QIH80_37295 [Bradyrhizobium elkanii]WLB82416.1 hypothetical protein QIH83_07480 [Bradyrhizobium elkanii]
MTVRRAPPIFASDIRRLGGFVRVTPVRDRHGGEPAFAVVHTSRGGDCVFQSRGLVDQDRADAAARVLAEFTGATFRT